MSERKNTFRHESLHDRESIQSLLRAVGKGLEKGELTFSDEDGEIRLHPKGLMNLKVTASREGSQNRLTFRVSWQSGQATPKKKKLKVKS
ncbi:MAG: amphi-Trp domain-containing protein [Gammaproteobacteria bacterium]|nr:amphi-Trp domain-containing protein [Gammaproteobacteria bacterium]